MTTLYRLFDHAGDLLYVGIADNWPSRMKQHAAEKPWWSQVASTRFTTFADRVDAQEAERAAIRSEHPRHNVVHNTNNRTGEFRQIDHNGQLFKIDDCVALGLSYGDCPVGIVTKIAPDYVELALYSWLTELFGFRIVKIMARDIQQVVSARPMSKADKIACGYRADEGLVWEMDPLADFQTSWVRRRKPEVAS